MSTKATVRTRLRRPDRSWRRDMLARELFVALCVHHKWPEGPGITLEQSRDERDEREVNQLARSIFTRAISSILIYEAQAIPDRRLLRLSDEAFRAADGFTIAALRRYRRREREERSAQLKRERAFRKARRRGKKKGAR